MSSLQIKSYKSDEAWGISLAIPDPSTVGKLNSICVAYFWNFFSRLSSGVPRMLCILWT